MIATDDQAELLRWHCRLGHLPFPALCQLAKNGEIPKRLTKVKPPRCAGCLFGKMTKVPWQTKSKADSQMHQATHAGECVSVDQLQSTQAGFFAQLKGRLKTKRYAATIFVDHFSRLRYIHLMTSMTSEETVQAKRTFELFTPDHGVAIKRYHADNGRFADTAFKQHCKQSNQTISYCGFNAPFQNGVVERAIRDITEVARTMLLHAKARWPSCVHLCLWPYALRNAVHVWNTAPVLPDGTLRLEKFSGTAVGFRMKDNHTFGCPVLALQNDLAAGNKIPKWSPCARLGLNLGPCPNHARNVNLVLNLSTGLCSPQFHCRFDDFFETTQLSLSDVETTSLWKQLAGFSRHAETPTQRNLPVRPIGTTQAPPPHDTPPDDDISFTNDVSTDDVNAASVHEGSTDIELPSMNAGVVTGDECEP
jgi:transposase InsO family protein